MSDVTVVLTTPDTTSVEVGEDNTILIIESETEVVSTDTAGPQGIQGPQGDQGDVPIYIGPTPPANHSFLWVDTSV